MRIWDFPCETPDSIKQIGRLPKLFCRTVSVEDVVGLCETCNKKDAEVEFNIGSVQHRMCKDCFKEMLELFGAALETNKEES